MPVVNFPGRGSETTTQEPVTGEQGPPVMPRSFPRRRPYGRLPTEPDPINWRRGLFRVWLLASSAWIMGWILYLLVYGVRFGFRGMGDILVIPILLLGPPVALLLFGLAAGWAFRGFNVEEAAPKDE